MRIVAPQSKCTRRSNDCPVRLITQLSNSLRLQLVLLIGGLAMSSAVAYVLLTTHLVQRQIEADQFKLQRILVTRMASQLD